MSDKACLVFLCYGNERVFHECAYALLSLSRLYPGGVPPGMDIRIYTDDPAWFSSFKDCPLPLSSREVSKDTIRQWRGKIDFVHRVKIEVLKDLVATFDGNVLYADTDVVFTYPIGEVLQGIASGHRYMHIMEGMVSDAGNPVLAKLDQYLRGSGRSIEGKPLHTLAMWNAGVLGFNTRDKALLDSVLSFTDEVHAAYPKHIVEQFAFSVYFGHDGNLRTAAPFIFHYWHLKEAGPLLASFFTHFNKASWEQLCRYATLVQLPNLLQEKANFYRNRTIAAAIAKKHWQPAIPDWGLMVKQL
jgi:hypothetical protein